MKKAIIIGAGPAGLTAAYELLKRTDILPIILEKSGDIGGISRTIDYKGNRMDMGPHRFFSKSDRVMEWWLNMMPLQEGADKTFTISYQNKSRSIAPGITTATDPDKRMLVIQRLTRIYFLRKFFAYPIQLSIDTLKILGFLRTIKILFSFLVARLFPRKAVSLADFIINQFGKELYILFFKDYTEKVWGVPCQDISAEWGAQRIKGVSLSKAIAQAVKSMRKGKSSDLGQKGRETSLIEQFLYPKYGPGSLWEEVARQVQDMGGKVYLHQQVQDIYTVNNEVCSIHTLDTQTGECRLFEGDYFFSSMPVKELIAGMGEKVPLNVQEVASGLQYRDFINVGILLKRMSAPGKDGKYEKIELKDNWIYIQERDVKVGRLMIYNNWGGGMIKDPNTVWIGMEYFCNKADDFWALNDSTIQQHAIAELEKMGLACVEDVLDATVRRMEKTYPAYFGTYTRFSEIREFVDKYENLFLVGRNGMHKYNNADHSMLTAMVAVDNICAGALSKDNLWAINTEQEYHEEKTASETVINPPIPGRRPRLAFIDYIWGNKWNRAYCIVAAISFIVQFILFKIQYPYANYMPDSYSYLDAAFSNVDVNMWPVAYSKFLRMFSVFSHSDKFLVGFQYIFMQISALSLLFTLLFFLRPGRIIRNILLVFFLFNPIPLYVANYISADALFIGASLLWFTTLIWILFRPGRWQIFLQAILLLICFVLRYNAIYYPFISGLAYLLSWQSWKVKMAGIAMGCGLVLCSFLYTSQKMADTTGTRQFSAFGGWQIANNALYMYEHIPPSSRTSVPARFARLDSMVRQHMDTLKKVKLTWEDSANGYFYLWSGRGPLHQYLERQYKKDSTTPYFTRWASEAPLYLDYAFYLIRKYPWSFMENFLGPNAMKFAVPPTEFLGVYNMGDDSVRPMAKSWFHYKSQQVKKNNKKFASFQLVEWYPIFAALANLLLLIHLAGLIFFGQFRLSEAGTRLLLVTVTLWLMNSAFSIFASPIVLRYQVFPVLLSFSIALLAGEKIYSSTSSNKSLVI
ncbi:NAD(P)/FAD-dependent oxidoreductase [Flavitalea sp. BT771]|uniref:NAD(P)/FAD-dependent oxidoreductase n=1 Tax=Flavitalea sp. BT771 TaxID=3063329 RepID=UPI0026E3C911|nr:NAD(P)/FAD-dependent oxidoreductase [Flavitalea sp. BT771]MDO6433062.1 NAD(P)/FAD-dependent oxidoreductase [Flavitalea sp. BT771]MDV6221662.1 NAD(P)/FAD-dependent oxidoreductase [Flavitalea sp. BT771]